MLFQFKVVLFNVILSVLSYYEDLQLLFLLSVQEAPAETEPKFNPFSGSGRRLDGKPLNYQPPPLSSSGSKEKKPDVSSVNSQSSTASSSQNTARQSQGKLVFGSNANRGKETGKVILLLTYKGHGSSSTIRTKKSP